MIPTLILMGTSHIINIALQASRNVVARDGDVKYDVMRCCFLSVASHSLVWLSFAMLRWWSHSLLTHHVHVLISLMLNSMSLWSWTFNNVCWLMEYHSSHSDSWHSEASVTLFSIWSRIFFRDSLIGVIMVIQICRWRAIILCSGLSSPSWSSNRYHRLDRKPWHSLMLPSLSWWWIARLVLLQKVGDCANPWTPVITHMIMATMAIVTDCGRDFGCGAFVLEFFKDFISIAGSVCVGALKEVSKSLISVIAAWALIDDCDPCGLDCAWVATSHAWSCLYGPGRSV